MQGRDDVILSPAGVQALCDLGHLTKFIVRVPRTIIKELMAQCNEGETLDEALVRLAKERHKL